MKLAFLMSAIGAFPEKQAYQACQLAALLDLPLTGITTSEDTLNHYVPVDGSYVDMLSASVEAAEINLKRSAEAFRALCAEKNIAQEWYGTHGFMQQEWEKLSAYFDLAIAGNPFSASELAMTGSTAILQLHPGHNLNGFDKRAVIAWDGSRPAARALKAALPILGRFREIDVLIVDPKSRTQPSDIGNYLAAHGLKATINTQSSGTETTGQVILDEARHADLLVMGAYGLSATLEKWFGGVTETVKTECQTPVLFAH